MTGDWPRLIEDFLHGGIGAAVFHDRFFALWRRDRDSGLPAPIEQLFYTVEAFTPDPSLRDASLPWEADEAELRQAAEVTLRGLQDRGG